MNRTDAMKVKTLLNATGVVSIFIAIGIFAALIKWPFISLSTGLGAVVIYAISSMVHPKTKWGKCFWTILSFPAFMLLGIVYLSGPALGIFSALFGASVFSALATGIVIVLYKLVGRVPSLEIILFLFVCLETIILSCHTDTIKRWMRHFGLWKAWEKDTAKQKLIVIGDYFFQTENMHFIISFVYLIFLFMMAFLNISSSSHLFSNGIDNAIWKAFLVYIAYSTMITRYQKTEATTDETAIKIFKMIFAGIITTENDNNHSEPSNKP